MAISLDLRERVVRAREHGEGTIAEIAARFAVSTSSVKRWCRLNRENGSPAPRPHGGGMPRSVDDERLILVVGMLPDATIPEIAEAYFEAGGDLTSESSICRGLKRTGLSRKKRRSMLMNATPTESSNSERRTGRKSPI